MQAVAEPSMPEVEMAAVSPVVEPKAAEESADHPGDNQMLSPSNNGLGSQSQCPRPRPVCNVMDHMQLSKTEDAFSLHMRLSSLNIFWIVFLVKQPDMSQGNNCHMEYSVNSNATWYTAQQGPYPMLLFIPQHFQHTYTFPVPCGPSLPSHPQPEHSVHSNPNVPPRYHDVYYPGVVNGSEQYHLPYQESTYHPIYPPCPPLAHSVPVFHVDGNGNPPPGTNLPQNVFRDNKEVEGNNLTQT
ncbi:hypothetical protein EDD17DRAFT_1511805 [Pisolithus thermaeus]|nr:hypothetical protein EDD17DRAFT_1511805 [Pisolithus thermaeus]